MINYNKSKYILKFFFTTVVNIPLKVSTNFPEWFTWMEIREVLTKAKETLHLVHLARDRFVKLCFWDIVHMHFEFFVGC